jgi:hygromycin-B 4-O-kinase
VPRGLVHNDMMNRNVHVSDDGAVTGVFDWGISLYGDHLYDLALIEFWAPWFPEIDAPRLRAAALERWTAVPGALDGFDERWKACILRIGLEHIGWNVYLLDRPEANRVAARMREFATAAGPTG